MHALHIARRLGVYQALYRINRSFANVLAQCNELQELKILKPNAARSYSLLTQELQAEINRGLAGVIEAVESRNHSRFVRERKAGEEKSRGSGRTSAPKKRTA